MNYLVDTDVAIGFLKGKSQEVSLLRNLSSRYCH